MSNSSYFRLINRISFDSLDPEKEIILPESDLCFSNNDYVVQFEYIKKEKEDRQFVINPGIFTLDSDFTNGSTILTPVNFNKIKLLDSILNHQIITNESDLFFNNLNIYKELEIEIPTRKLLLYSDPGMGKSSTISQYARIAVENDPNTVVIMWNTSKIPSRDVLDFLSIESKYSEKCSKLIFIMEDIGGGQVGQDHHQVNPVDSSLLSLLDGIESVFKIPTLVISTTNYPQALLSALADRPGRFDALIELMPPSLKEKISIIEFIGKRPIDEDTKKLLSDNKFKTFSVAHLKECVIRSRLHNRPLTDVLKEMADYRDKYKNRFEEKNEMGFGGGR